MKPLPCLRGISDSPRHCPASPQRPGTAARHAFDAGFTLVEVLVASTVLVLLIVVTAQLINNATRVVGAGDRRVDADSVARLVFLRLAQDVEGMVRRPDADLFFVKNTGNDAFYFYSQSLGSYPGGEGPPAPFALVGYRIANRANPSVLAPNGILERIGVGLGYDNNQPGKIIQFLTYPPPSTAVPSPTPMPMQESTIAWTHGAEWASASPASNDAVGDPPTWDGPPFVSSNQAPLSSQVFRLEFCFLMDDGTYFAPPTPGAQPWSNTDFFTATNRIRSHAVGLVVTMAVLDSKSQQLMTQSSTGTPDFTKVISALKDGDTPGIAATWQQTLQTSIASPGTIMTTFGMPLAAASQIRFYQRSFRFAR